MKEQKKHLYYLDELSDYKVDNHYTDVSGWSVKDRDNRVIGKVVNLLVNKNLLKVVYLDVEVDKTIIDADYDPYSNSQNSEVREFVNKEGENHVIIPVGMVQIHEDQKFVHTESINYQTFAETKRFSSGANLDREYEVNVLDSYRRTRNNQDNQHTDKDHQKDSPYGADREEAREKKLTSDSDFSEERRKLEDERHKLKEERLKLEEERRKLESERNIQEHNRDTASNPTLNETEREENYSNSERYADDDSFYERGEFD